MIAFLTTIEYRVERADKKFMLAFAKRLTACRIAGGDENAADLAAALNIPPHTYRRYERAEVLPAYDRLNEIARLTKSDFHFLATGENN